MTGAYSLGPLLVAFNVQGIFEGLASFIANLAMLYIINRFVVSIQTESNARNLSDEEARVETETDLLVSGRFNMS